MRSPFAFSALLAAACLAGCASVAPTPASPAPAATRAPVDATPPADDTLNATAWFQSSVERDLIYREVYRAASAHLSAALADKRWDALPREDRSNDPRRLPPAIIVDVDETVLDNSPNQVRQILERRGFDSAAWKAWVEERAAKPLPGAREFLNSAAQRGVTIFYISNRNASQAQATVDNLRQAGFPIADATQFLGLGTPVEGCQARGSEKSCRRQWVGRTHRVLMQFGDQLGDFIALTDNSLDGRRAAMSPYADWIGQRWWMLPNPMYGSWESPLWGNAQGLDEGQRRARKESALDPAK